MSALTQGRLGTAFVDRSGTTNGSANTFTPALALNTNRQFARIQNTHATAKLYVYDKAGGTPTTANSIVLPAGEAYVWDVKVPTSVIQIASDTVSVPYEAAEG